VAAELGIDVVALARPDGPPVRAQDVLAAAAQQSSTQRARAHEAPQAPRPAQPATRSAEVSGPDAMRQAIARLMSRSKREIPHYYLSTTVDLARALDWLHEQNRARPVADRLVPAALLLKATALAAEAMPAMNGFWVDDAFRPAPQVHLGLAISLRGGGLVAPALHDAAHLELAELMARMRDLVARARAGRLRGSELSDPTITVTNLGEQGVESVHGVIYPPQVALVGFGRVTERPWAVDGLIGVRPLTTLTLAGDHRATDGFTGARFLADIDRRLQLPEEL
jgi:pyruvate dehydrogenase E2 component (dihydrolipoamide acetyltransferase)